MIHRFQYDCSEVLCVAMVFICGAMKFPEIVRSLLTKTMAGWVHYNDWKWDFGMGYLIRFASYFSYLLDYFIFQVIKGLRMVAHALWRSEALKVVPWLRLPMTLWLIQGLRPRLNSMSVISTLHGQPFLISSTHTSCLDKIRKLTPYWIMLRIHIEYIRPIAIYPVCLKPILNYINPGYGLSLVDTLWNASSYRQPLEQEGNPMT